MSRSLIAIRHLEPEQIGDLLEMGRDFKKQVEKHNKPLDLGPHTVGLLFFEGSTRTRVGFEQAAYYLGYKTVNFATQGSSIAKGETLKDTILTLRYKRLEGLVMRHRSSGAPQLADQFFGGPVLNAGDGRHEHPTQALGDAITILDRKGGIEGLKVAIVGDVDHSRVARSNAWLLSKMGAEVRFVGPRTLMPAHTSMLPGTVYYDLHAGIEDCDVVMCLRLQKERMHNGLIGSVDEYRRFYQIDKAALKSAARDALVMHPGPLNRGIEVDDTAADSKASAITDQVTNCIYACMAGLHWCFQPEEQPKPKSKARATKKKAKA